MRSGSSEMGGIGAAGSVQAQLHLVRRGRGGEPVDHALYQGWEIRGRALERQLTRIHQRQGAQILHQAGEQPVLLQHLFQVFHGQRVDTVLHRLQVGALHGERVAQLVSDVGGHGAAGCLGPLQRLCHVVERLSERGDFVAAAHRHPLAQVAALPAGLPRGSAPAPGAADHRQIPAPGSATQPRPPPRQPGPGGSAGPAAIAHRSK